MSELPFNPNTPPLKETGEIEQRLYLIKEIGEAAIQPIDEAAAAVTDSLHDWPDINDTMIDELTPTHIFGDGLVTATRIGRVMAIGRFFGRGSINFPFMNDYDPIRNPRTSPQVRINKFDAFLKTQVRNGTQHASRSHVVNIDKQFENIWLAMSQSNHPFDQVMTRIADIQAERLAENENLPSLHQLPVLASGYKKPSDFEQLQHDLVTTFYFEPLKIFVLHKVKQASK